MKIFYKEGFDGLLNICENLANKKKRAIITIDGRAASGKTTVAGMIAERVGGCIVHADDFFLPPDMRTSERLRTPGGNIHHERFALEVIEKLGKSFDYGVFDCSVGKVTGKKHIEADCPVIIEGAYSASPVFGRYYDLLIFVTASYDVRMERIIMRNGMERAKLFENRWIPLEETYFEAFGTDDIADILLDTTDI